MINKKILCYNVSTIMCPEGYRKLIQKRCVNRGGFITHKND